MNFSSSFPFTMCNHAYSYYFPTFFSSVWLGSSLLAKAVPVSGLLDLIVLQLFLVFCLLSVTPCLFHCSWWKRFFLLVLREKKQMKTTFVSVLASLCCLLTHLSFTRVLEGVKNLWFLTWVWWSP